MNLKTWNQMQIKEADSPINRYFFWLNHRREPTDFAELMMFYITNGGAEDFAKNNRRDYESKTSQEVQK